MNKIKEDDEYITIDKEKMEYNIISPNTFFQLPKNFEKEKNNLSNGYKRPYWYLFLNPPHTTNYKI